MHRTRSPRATYTVRTSGSGSRITHSIWTASRTGEKLLAKSLAGGLYLAVAVLAAFGNMYVPSVLGSRGMWRVAVWSVHAVARLCETFASIFGTRSPFTKDFITIGRVPHFGDTSRMREDLLPTLTYPTLDDGLSTLE